MLRLQSALREEIERHGRDTYPDECCGFLIGAPGAPRVATRVHRLVNRLGEGARDRYEVDPLEWLRVERTISGSEQVVGIYHSHPDRPARPSELDRRHAHPHLSYVILAVGRGGVVALRSWELHSETGVFEEETVQEAS